MSRHTLNSIKKLCYYMCAYVRVCACENSLQATITSVIRPRTRSWQQQTDPQQLAIPRSIKYQDQVANHMLPDTNNFKCIGKGVTEHHITEFSLPKTINEAT